MSNGYSEALPKDFMLMLVLRARCSITTDSGFPVDPEVYSTYATYSGFTDRGSLSMTAASVSSDEKATTLSTIPSKRPDASEVTKMNRARRSWTVICKHFRGIKRAQKLPSLHHS